MNSIKLLENRILEIERRNKKVEIDKAWEVSKTRKIFIIITTYLTLGIYMQYINISKPWLNAIIPTFAFVLSTLTYPFVRRFWENNIKK